MSRSLRLIAGLLVLGVVLGLALERAIVTEREELGELLGTLQLALEEEDPAAMRRFVSETFVFEGPLPVGEGDRSDVFSRLDSFWSESSDARLRCRELELIVEGSVGRIRCRGSARFDWEGGGLVVYRISLEIAALRGPAGWTAQEVDVLEMSPGLF